MSFAAVMLVATAAGAQDTTVVIVRHLPAQQDTGVVVRHLAPAPQPQQQQQPQQPQQARSGAPYGAPYGAPRYGLRSTTVIAKDPNIGTSLSLIFPGGGQYYAGATNKGILLTALAIGAPIIGYANVTRQNVYYNGYTGPGPMQNGSSCNVYNQPAAASPQFCRNSYNWTPAAIGLGVGVGAWLYGIATAGSDVQHWNQAHGVRFMSAPGRVGFAVAVP